MASPSASSLFPGFSNVYQVEDPCGDRPFRATLDLPDALALLRGEAAQADPIRGHWAMGSSVPKDIVWTTLSFPIVLSERVIRVLQEGRFSGWDVIPVHLTDKTGKKLPTYYYLCVSGRCGAIDDARSKEFKKVMPGGIFPWWRGLYFDPKSWDGSDVFTPAGDGARVFVTESVKNAFDKAKIKNVVFTRLDEVERMTL